MRVPIYRALRRSVYAWDLPVHALEPVVEQAEGWVPRAIWPGPFRPVEGTGADPWIIVDVPDGSQLEYRPPEAEEDDSPDGPYPFDKLHLVLPDGEVLDATGVFARF